jgi:hypothetical protein
MQPSQLIRGTRALVFVALSAVAVTNVFFLATATPPPATYRVPEANLDIVVQAERRFAAVRAALARRGINGPIAYFESPPGTAGSAVVSDSFLAQYALVPVVLDRNDTRSAWALGNFPPAIPATVPDGWETAEAFGNGVILLRRSPQ